MLMPLAVEPRLHLILLLLVDPLFLLHLLDTRGLFREGLLTSTHPSHGSNYVKIMPISC